MTSKSPANTVNLSAQRAAPRDCHRRGHGTEGEASMPSQFSRACDQCGAPYTSEKRHQRYCSIQCAGVAKRIPVTPRPCRWCGTIFVPSRERVQCCSRTCSGHLHAEIQGMPTNLGQGKSYRQVDGDREHRFIAQRMIGRSLGPDEVVHHINGDFRDNRPENLQVMTRAEHTRLHHKGRRRDGSRGKLLPSSKAGDAQ